MQRRLVKAFDQFHEVQASSDRDVAALIHNLQIDIAIDLKGYTRDARPEILSFRPAPIQVNFLGFPGTMGADFMDYIIADKTVLPFDRQPFYTEKIVHLPDCYQPNDSMRAIAERTGTRLARGFLTMAWCLRCNSHKITAPLFYVDAPRRGAGKRLGCCGTTRAWRPTRAALARGVPQRALFLLTECRSTRIWPISPGRSVSDTPLQCQRQRACPLGSVPVPPARARFCRAGGGNLLQAVGLPELVTHGLAEYEAAARRLATDPARLGAIRRKLEQNRRTHPLFDTDRFRGHIETAYTTMWDILQRGGEPQSFSVEAREASGR